MKKTALVLVAHGSRHEPAVNEQVRQWATQVARRTYFDEVAVAFHQGTPTFAEVLDTLTADEVTVVPVMTSAGYYSDTVLPRELARSRRYPQIALHQTAPLGLHPAIPRLIANRANALRIDHDLPPESCHDFALAIVGHGTPRHPASRNATLCLAQELRAKHDFSEVIALFLDDEPRIDSLLSLTARPNIIVIPFLIAAGPHATSDIPRRIGETTAGRRVICDVPFGTYPEMIDLMIDLASPHLIQDSRIGRPKQKEVA